MNYQVEGKRVPELDIINNPSPNTWLPIYDTTVDKTKRISLQTIINYVNTNISPTFTQEDVRETILDGLDTSIFIPITSSDNVLSAFGKLQGQISVITSSENLSTILTNGNDATNQNILNLGYITNINSKIDIINKQLLSNGVLSINWNNRILADGSSNTLNWASRLLQVGQWDYDTDYSGSCTLRSIVDKNYVDLAIIAGATYIQGTGI